MSLFRGTLYIQRVTNTLVGFGCKKELIPRETETSIFELGATILGLELPRFLGSLDAHWLFFSTG
jgi:hypothetical protein